MIRVPITYVDFDDNKVTEYQYFHLSKSEIIDWMTENDGEDLVAMLTRVGKSGDGGLIMKTFRGIIRRAHGQRVDGSGGEFWKDKEFTDKFMGSLAFDQFFVDIITNQVSAAAFINGIMPADLDKMAAAANADRTTASKGGEALLPEGTITSRSPNGVLRVHTSLDHKIFFDSSGLNEPYDPEGNPLPWAHREPTHKEQQSMHPDQLRDAFRRKSSDWVQPAVPAEVLAPQG